MSRTRALLYSCVFVTVTLVAACGPGVDPGPTDPGNGGGEQPQPVTFQVKLENKAPWTVLKSGVYNTPVGKTAPGPIKSGDAYEFTFTAGKNHRLSFASMFGASNDWFYGTAPEGIALYENGVAISGDVTSQIHLYNAGTEVDEEPAVGADTGPKQAAPDQGAPDPDDTVRELVNPIALTGGGTFTMPAVSEVLKVTLTPTANAREFKVRIENVSTANTLMTSDGAKGIGISPGVYVVHSAANPLFTLGEKDRGEGLELIAESGRVMNLSDAVAAKSGVATGFSPLEYLIHDSGAPIFSVDQKDRGQGLERIAESGNVSVLDDAFNAALPEGAKSHGVANMPDGATKAGAIGPGASYTFEVQALPGERFSFASMFGASNDWIVGTPQDGIALFGSDGKALSGDFTSDLHFYDVGTEADEELAVGAHTGPNQDGPDSGDADPVAKVREVTSDRYARTPAEHLTLTITAK